MTGFLLKQVVKMNEPIVQLFLRPFGRPWVVVADFQEGQDVLVHRTREFDRASFFGDLFVNILPTHQVHLPTGPEWKVREHHPHVCLDWHLMRWLR